jgi:antitoxin ParD1/3/4
MPMQIRLPASLEEFIQSKVDSGLYGNPSEVIGDALRLLRRQDELDRRKLDALRSAIETGIASGIAEDSSFDSINAELDAELDGPHGEAH